MNAPSRYQPPRHPLEALSKLGLDEAVLPTDPRFVNLDAARGGDNVPRQLARKFGLQIDGERLFVPPSKKHVLLFGPIGSGKSTELARFVDLLERDTRLMPVLLNVRGEIDINDLQYADVLLALAYALTKKLEQLGIGLDAGKLTALTSWFGQHVFTKEREREFSAQLKTEMEAAASIPLFARVMAKITASMKARSTQKESLREEIRNTFTQFTAAFNELLLAAEAALNAADKADRIVLIADGTDKIPLADAERLFVSDSEQLIGVSALVLYTAPISLKYGRAALSKFETGDVLPIVKLENRDGTRFAAGWSALRRLLDLRIDPDTFAAPDLRDRLIEYSGGHPRELLRLLSLACELAENNIDASTVEKAINKHAGSFRYWLSPEDYELLARIDLANGQHIGNDEQCANLLYRLALLHYNDGSWRRSHPAVRRLEGYQVAWDKLTNAPPPA
jgi:hypothetical protein